MLELVGTEFFVLNGSDMAYPDRDARCLDPIATAVYGMPYVGQQTDGCLARGGYVYDFSDEEEMLQWCDYFDLRYPVWKAAFDKGHEYDFVIYRQAPGIAEVIADLIRREELPRGRYLVRIDW